METFCWHTDFRFFGGVYPVARFPDHIVVLVLIFEALPYCFSYRLCQFTHCPAVCGGFLFPLPSRVWDLPFSNAQQWMGAFFSHCPTMYGSFLFYNPHLYYFFFASSIILF